MARMNAEYFEYDEDVESDEAFESDESDEAFESDESDESDEAFESDESDESDEAFESDESDEAFESDESDESDEAIGAESGEGSDEASATPSASYSARIAARDRARSAAWERKVNADVRADARRALVNQRRLNQRLRRAARTKTQVVPSLKGAGVVTLRLPNGRQTRALISPRPALASEVNRLRSALASNDRRQAKTLSKVSAMQARGFTQLTGDILRGDKDLARRIVQGDNALNKRITKEVATCKVELVKYKKLIRQQRTEKEIGHLQNALLLTFAIPIWSKQVDQSNLFAPRNLKMAASNVFWLLSDEIFGALQGGKNKAWTKNLGWLSVAGNVATMLYIGHEEQQERFVSGVWELDTDGKKTIKASEFDIAKNYEKDFEGIVDPRTVVSYIDPKVGADTGAVELSAQWTSGKLVISGRANAKVAVIVDTWEKNADT